MTKFLLTKIIFEIRIVVDVVWKENVGVPFVLIHPSFDEVEPVVLLQGSLQFVEPFLGFLESVRDVDEKFHTELEL